MPFDAAGQPASTVVRRSDDTSSGTGIQIIVDRPRPALQSLSIRLGTDTIGVAPDDVMLATPSGDWLALTFDTTDGGDVTVAAEGMGWTSIGQRSLFLSQAASGEDQPSESMPRTHPLRRRLGAWHQQAGVVHGNGSGPDCSGTTAAQPSSSCREAAMSSATWR